MPAAVTSVLTTMLTLGMVKSGTHLVKRRKYAFSLKLGTGPVWHLTKLARPRARHFSYRIVDRSLLEKEKVLEHPTLEPGTGYGIWYIEPGDTIEVYWREGRRQHSTFQMIHDEQREYLRRRENKGH